MSEMGYSRIHQDAYEGATTAYRLELRGLRAGKQDDIAATELNALWQRGHHIIRNNGDAKSAKDRYLENMPPIKVKWKNSKGAIGKKLQAHWDDFIADICADGYGNIDNLQILLNAARFESGEVFLREVIRKGKGIVPLAYQVIEAEQLDPAYTLPVDNIYHGIEFDELQKPVAYHFFRYANAYSGTVIPRSYERVRVPANEVIHYFKRERPGQWRGVSELVQALIDLYQLEDLEDATAQQQINAQAASWIVSNSSPSSALAIGSALPVGDINDIDPATGQQRVITKSVAGGVVYANKGEVVTQVQSADIGNNLSTFIKRKLHKIARTLGLPYSVLTGDTSELSFSALQAIAREMRERAEFTYRIYLINLVLSKICARFQELAILYTGNKSFADYKPFYQLPRRYGVNELADAQADLLEIGGGIGLLEQKLEERDISYEELTDDLEKQRKLAEKQAEIAKLKNPKLAGMKQPSNFNANSNTSG